MTETTDLGATANPPDPAARRVGPLSVWVADSGVRLIEVPIGDLLSRRAEEQGGRPAVYWLDGAGLSSWSYGELALAARRVAGALARLTGKGDRVAVWSRNRLEWLVVEYAAALAGVVLTPFNGAWSNAEVTHALELTGPRLIFVAGEALSGRAHALATDATVVDLNELDVWAAEVGPADLPTVTPDDPFLIQFTSGTTGRAKGALLSHRAALNCAYQRNRAEVIVNGDCYLNPVPFHHVGGSCSVVLGALADGGAIVLLERWVPDDVVRLLDLGVVTRVGGVPTMMIDLVRRLTDGGRDYGLASVSVGGAQVPESLIHRVKEVFGAPVINTYAQSESPMITTTSAGDGATVVATTVGRPAPGVDLAIVDPRSGEPVPLGTPGEVVVRSPYTMTGYWEMPEQTAAALTRDGYLRTGDLASMDERGCLTFRGRARDVIIRGGENIYPAEVEDVLVEHPGVDSAVVVGIDDERWGERVGAVVVRAKGSTVTGEELAELLAGRVARFKIPVAWRFVEDLPMTASGKVRRFLVPDDANAAVGNETANGATTPGR